MNDKEQHYDEGIESEDLVLDEDVTGQFEAKRPLGIVMPLRLRLSREESLALDEIVRRTGLSRTDIVLASLRATLASGALPASPPVPAQPRP